MALSDDVTARYSTQRLVELTNPDDRTATTVDTTVLGLAATDAAAEFQVRTSVVYDSADATHTAVGVQGVIYYLYLYRGLETPKLREAETKWRDGLAAVARTTGLNRITPSTSSVLTPTSEQVGVSTVRPDTDRRNFRDLVPNDPRSIGRSVRRTNTSDD